MSGLPAIYQQSYRKAAKHRDGQHFEF
jgi:hypothetical protein